MLKNFLIMLAVLVTILVGGAYYVYSHRYVLAEKAVNYAVEEIVGGTTDAEDGETKTWLANLLASGSDNVKKALVQAAVNKGLQSVSGQQTGNSKHYKKVKRSPGLATMADMLANGASGENNADLAQIAQMLASTLGVQTNPQAMSQTAGVEHDINALDAKGRTLLMNVCRTNVSAKIVKLIIKYGAEVNIQDDNGRTALMYATALNGDPDVIRLLLNAGAESDIRDYSGKTAYDYATETSIKNILSPAQ